MVRFGKKSCSADTCRSDCSYVCDRMWFYKRRCNSSNGWRGKDHAWSGKFLCKTAAGAVRDLLCRNDGNDRGGGMWSQDASDGKDYEEQTKDNIMESLENLYLLSQHASEYNVSLSDDEKKAIKDAAEQFGKR